ncbi:hypothetical protein NIES267_57830 [Calothrix parasitica NIES-267]|uniref:Uncharacterized protein n=1 Tax=Calothrix parasitica NIES-267 TaxID=1973488 RepID=A0A1Z4LYH2_9CYAN|nr:hypothetical protein NIES267_57830 [Calothrix parasitica NIES-267]
MPEFEQFTWYEVSDDIKELLKSAADNSENTSEREKYINQALSKTDNELDVLIAAYRYFFYKQKYQMALETAEKVQEKAKQEAKLPDAWEDQKPILIKRQAEQIIQTYVNAYSATGIIFAAQGKAEKAQEVSDKVKNIDPANVFTAGVLADISTLGTFKQ